MKLSIFAYGHSILEQKCHEIKKDCPELGKNFKIKWNRIGRDKQELTSVVALFGKINGVAEYFILMQVV